MGGRRCGTSTVDAPKKKQEESTVGAQQHSLRRSGRPGYLAGLLRGQSLGGPSRHVRGPVELIIIHQLWNRCALLKGKK